MKLHRILFLSLLLGCFVVHADDTALKALTDQAPLIKPQADGVVFLNVEAAALISVGGRQPKLINQEGGTLKVEKGTLATWNADQELPFWRIELPKAGRYRVVLNHATNIERESTAEISFRGKRRQAITSPVDSTGSWDIFASTTLGEVDLDAGETVVEYRPTRWINAQWVIKIADIRLIPLDGVQRLASSVHALLEKLGVNTDQEVMAVQQQYDLAKKRNAENRVDLNRNFSTYTSYQQFLKFDEATTHSSADLEKEKELARKLDAIQQEKLKSLSTGDALSEADRDNLKAYFAAAGAVLDGSTRSYPKIYFLPVIDTSSNGVTRAGYKPLFPTGHFEDLQFQQIDTTLPPVTLKLSPPADLPERKARFDARDSDDGIAVLCRDFYAKIKPETPGLENFSRLYQAGHYQEALDAYRTYFFDKLAQPEKYGAHTENILFELTRDRGKGHLLFRPNPTVLDYNLHDCAVAEFNHQLLVGQVGPPGSVCWAPPDMGPPAATYRLSPSVSKDFLKSDRGIELLRENQFFRRITFLPSDREEYFTGGFFPALLFSYALSGNKDHLDRWSAYADDWTMNSAEDEENCPSTPRLATELETQKVRATFTLMRIILDERPDFAHDLNSATLVRLLMHFEEDYAPYVFRAKRTEQANWGMMGISHALDVANFLPEFRASDYMMREAWRLWNMDIIQYHTLDGEDIESWDTGHQIVFNLFSNDSVPFVNLPASNLEKIRYWDGMKTGMRNLLVHISPAGFYWPPETAHLDLDHNDLRYRWLKPDLAGRFALNRIVDEKGAQQRINAILGDGKASSLGDPPQTSDFSPYASMAYLRDSWQPAADDFILQDFRDRCQALEDCGRGMYQLSAGSRVILKGQSLAVDGRPDNRFYGKIPTGGKTDYCAEAGSHVSSDRFYTSAQFDFAEATQDSPFAHPRLPTAPGLFGIYRSTADGQDDPSPVTDVVDHRHIFHMRGSGAWIVSDRIENKGKTPHDYAQFVALPARLPSDGFADRVRLLDADHYPLIEEDPSQGRVRSANPGLENVSTYFIGPTQLTFGNRLDQGTKLETISQPVLKVLKAELAKGRTSTQVSQDQGQRPFAASWNGAGNQSLLTVHYSMPISLGLSAPFANDLSKFEAIHGHGKLVGCHLITPKGVEVWFESGPDLVNALSCGPLSADAEALMVTKQEGQIRGLLLGGKTVRIKGRKVSLNASDCEFSVDSEGSFAEIAPIRHAIDTVQVLPKGDVFTDEAKVSFAIPTQDTNDIEFHYTLDGSDPTLDSKLYDKPFTITETALVKVRPFRKGLKATPWVDNGTDSGVTVSALFRREAPLPPVRDVANLQPGLNYHYFEGPWPRLFTYAGIDGLLKPKKSGNVASLLDPKETEALRQTDRSYAIRYEGYIQVPATNVYAFYAPDPLYETTMDAGYDLRVFVDGHEWYPTPALHSRNVWNVALEKGLHSISVAYVDYRRKTFRNEYWMEWQPEEMWKGTPALEISSADLPRQAIPTGWFVH
jgi:hypothetical protein